MDNIKFGDIADVISVIAGLMTIFGFGGFLSWSFFRKDKGTLADNSISVFAFSVKTGICFLLLWPMSALFFGLHIFVVLSLGRGSIGGADFFWNSGYPFAYLASYALAVLLLVPLYIILSACIYTGSFAPFRSFFRAFRGFPIA
jgi:hypothetical protein